MPITAIRLFTAALLVAGTAANAATFVVTRGDDPAPGACVVDDCSLREAIAATAATPEADTIVLGAGQYQVTIGPLVVSGDITIRGAGSTATRLFANGAFTLVRAASFGNLTLESLEAGSVDGDAVIAEDNGAATLRDVLVAASSGGVGTDNTGSDTGTGSIRIEHSTIKSGVACFQPQGICRVSDSRVRQFLVDDAELELTRVDVDGEGLDVWGITIGGTKAVTIEDSTVRHTQSPLTLIGNGDSAAAVHIRRTRFLDNSGPLRGDRTGFVFLDEVEFRRHVVSDAMLDSPAVLLAGPGTAWYISEALIANNRGGATLDGAVVRVLGGGRVIVDNSTFDDNTFRGGAGNGYGHTIGVYNNSGAATILWLIHATMRRSAALTDTTTGSLLTVRGPSSDVRVYNSALRGTCAFGGGGAITAAIGNVESPGHTCTFDASDNLIDVPTFQASFGDLDDHGGFTDTLVPDRASMLRNNADPALCSLFAPLDQRRYVRPADGVDCDVGGVETDAIPDVIFADDFDGT